MQQLRSETEKPTVTATETEKAIDPVCGMEVRVEDARYVSLLEGKHFYFCCSGCKTKFEKALKISWLQVDYLIVQKVLLRIWKPKSETPLNILIKTLIK